MTDHLVRQLLDVEAIKQLKARYFRYVDTKQWTELAALFTASPHIDFGDVVFTDATEFATSTGSLIGQTPTVHHGHMPEVELTGPDTATGVWAMEDLVTVPSGPHTPYGHHGYGHYHETYQRVDGRWRIARLKLTRLRLDPLDETDPRRLAGVRLEQAASGNRSVGTGHHERSSS